MLFVAVALAVAVQPVLISLRQLAIDQCIAVSTETTGKL